MLTQEQIAQLIADIEAGTYTIENAFADIASGQYGEDVRKAMYAGLFACYNDGRTGATDAVARQNIKQLLARMDTFERLEEGSTTGDLELIAGRIDIYGTTHPNIGDNIRFTQQDTDDKFSQIKNNIGTNQKLLRLIDYDVSPGAYKFSDKTTTTSLPIYYHLDAEVSGMQYLLITGYAYSTAYGLYGFLDADGNVLSYDSAHAAGIQIYNELVEVPVNAAKVIVNIYYSTASGNREKNYGIMTGDNSLAHNLEDIKSISVKVGYDALTGTIVNGKAYKITGDEVSGSAYQYGRFNVENAPELLISGWHYSDDYPLYIVFDEDDTILYRAHYGDTGHAESAYIKLPENAAYIIVNGSASINTFGPASVCVYSNVSLADYIKNPRKKYLIIGDSYCEGYSHDGNNDGWGEYLADCLALSENEYTIAYRGGARFSANGSDNTFESLLPIPKYPGEYTDVVVCGGYNDNAYTADVIESGIQSFIHRCNVYYPGAKIHVGCVAFNKEGDGEGAIDTWETIRNNIETVVIPAYHAAANYGAAYLVNSEYLLGENGLTHSDGYHPSKAGNRQIAEGIANALISGAAFLTYDPEMRNN